MRIQALQKCLGLREIEFLVARFNAQEKTVRGRRGKAFDVERRVVRRRQPIQRQHSKDGGKGRAQVLTASPPILSGKLITLAYQHIPKPDKPPPRPPRNTSTGRMVQSKPT